MAQDVIGRRDVKEDLRHAECRQQRLSGECALLPFLNVNATSLSTAARLEQTPKMPIFAVKLTLYCGLF